MKKYLFAIFIIIALACGFGGGYLYFQHTQPSLAKIQTVANAELNKPSGVDFNLFWDVWSKVEQKYVDRSKIDRQKMVYGAIQGMLAAIGDPYTNFFPPQETKDFTQEIKNGEFGGVGMEVGLRKNIITVIAPLDDSPAAKAGILAGDKILKIGNDLTANMNVDEAVSKIRGEKGTEVVLTISRDGWTKAQEFKIKRDTIKIPILRLTDKDGFAYIRFYEFTENSGDEFQKIVQQVLTSHYKGIILDLRNNPGGYLDSAVDIASWFLPAGDVVVSEDFGNGKKDEHKSLGYNALNNMPVVILINQGSASASEILAGALRDQLGIKLIGDKSYGKGSVQEFEQLSGASSMKVTIAKWLTPKGTSINDNGLDPDVKVEITEDQINADQDPQLDKALEVIKGIEKFYK